MYLVFSIRFFLWCCSAAHFTSKLLSPLRLIVPFCFLIVPINAGSDSILWGWILGFWRLPNLFLFSWIGFWIFIGNLSSSPLFFVLIGLSLVCLSGTDKKNIVFIVVFFIDSTPTLSQYQYSTSLIDPDTVQELLELTLSFSNFAFDTYHYLQIQGLSMGSTVTLIFPNILMRKYERFCLLPLTKSDCLSLLHWPPFLCCSEGRWKFFPLISSVAFITVTILLNSLLVTKMKYQNAPTFPGFPWTF